MNGISISVSIEETDLEGQERVEVTIYYNGKETGKFIFYRNTN